jgi:tetratricopeptide (TPR) repeat protein
MEHLLSIASEAINNGRPTDALIAARSALDIDSSNAEAKLIEAIALSQVGDPMEASTAFEAAIRLNPASAKSRFNAGVHAFNGKNFDLARDLAMSAIQIEPNHAGAKQLLSQLPKEFIDEVPASDTFSPAANAAYPRYESQEGQSAALPFITQLGTTWTVVGVLLSILGFILFLITLMALMPKLSEMMVAAGNSVKLKEIQDQIKVSPVVSIVTYISYGANVIYVILDLIHRRGNMLWLVGHIPASCCCGLGWITLPLYMLFGRK